MNRQAALLAVATALCLAVLAHQSYRAGERSGYLDWSMQCQKAAWL